MVERGLFAKTAFLEVYPPQIKVMRLSKDPPGVGFPHPIISVSMGDTVKDLCTKVADAVKTDETVDTPYRVWKPTNPSDDWRSIDLPLSVLPEADAKVIDESAQTLGDQNIESGDLFIVEFKQPDGWLVDTNAPKKPLAIEAPPPLFNSKDNFFNRFGASSSSKATTKTSSEFSTSLETRPTASSFSLKNNYNTSRTLEPGTLGLGNMCVQLHRCYNHKFINFAQGKYLLHELRLAMLGTHERTFRLFFK